MNARDYTIIDHTPDNAALLGYQDGFLGLPDKSQAPAYVLAYAIGGAAFARLSLSI